MMTSFQKQLFIFSGEASGDLHGSYLVKAFKKCGAPISISGIAGPRMRGEGVTGPLTMENFEVMGFTDVLRAIHRLYGHFLKIRDHILSQQPHGVVLIDYPGFNLRMAKALRKCGYQGKIVQYISPSIWAWGKHRIASMENTLDLLLSIYPFEPVYFSGSRLPVTYVGNPISEYVQKYQYNDNWWKEAGLPSTNKLIALFPGSRSQEIQRNLPLMLEASKKLKQQDPHLLFGISQGHSQLDSMLSFLPDRLRDSFFPVPKKYTYELMRDSCTAVAKSGTVTLELALHNRPTVAIYKLTTLNRLYAKYLLRLNLPHYCIVNLLAKRTVFPELIESGLSINNLFQQLDRLHSDGKERTDCLYGCVKIQKLLSHNSSSASTQAAESLISLLKC